MPLDFSTDHPIFKWCHSGKLTKVQRILARYPEALGLKSTKNGGITPLLAAVRGNRLATVQWLITHKKASCSECDDLGATALIWAAHNGNQPMIEYLLTSGSTIEECGKFGDTALTWAAYKRHVKLCQWLIEKAGANPYRKDEFGSSIFLWATEGGEFTLIQWLLESGYGTLDERDADGNTALLIAAKTGYLHLMQPLLERGAAVDARNNLDEGVLTQAAMSGNLQLVQWLANADNSNLRDPSLKEPLFTAIQYNHKHIVQWIVDHSRILVVAIDKNRNTPLSYAAKYGRLPILKWLVSRGAGASITGTNDYSHTALHEAAKGGYYNTLVYLLDMGANAEARDINGDTPLLWAAYNGHLNIVQFLINSKKASWDVRNQHGDTIFLSAALKGQLHVMQWLLEWKPSLINDQDIQGDTALFKAACHGHLEVVHWLVNLAEIAVNHKDHMANTVLMAAANKNCFEIVRYFLDNKIVSISELNHEGKSALDLALENDENGKTALFLYHSIKFTAEADHLFSERPRNQLHTLCLGEQQEISRFRMLCQQFLAYGLPRELIQCIHILEAGCLTEIAAKRIYDEEVLYLEFSKRKAELLVGNDFLNGLNFMMQKPKAHEIPSEKKLLTWKNLNANLLLVQYYLKEDHKIPPEHNPIHTLVQKEIKALQSEVAALQKEKANLQQNYNFILKTMGKLCLLGGTCLALVLTSTSSDSQERSFLNRVMATTFVGGLGGAYCFFKRRQEKQYQQQENTALSHRF